MILNGIFFNVFDNFVDCKLKNKVKMLINFGFNLKI